MVMQDFNIRGNGVKIEKSLHYIYNSSENLISSQNEKLNFKKVDSKARE